MRPVNLIPPEERRGEKAPMRTGALSYVIVAVLAVALLGVTGVVLTNNKISERESEKSGLESQLVEAEAQAERVSSFANFASLKQAREETVASLAQSRFDWERVLRELAIVIPEDVWLTQLTAMVNPEVQLSDAGSGSSSGVSGMDSVLGPALQIQGCGSGHEAVAGFLAALRDIGGVTRVAVLNSDLPDPCPEAHRRKRRLPAVPRRTVPHAISSPSSASWRRSTPWRSAPAPTLRRRQRLSRRQSESTAP